MKNPTYFNRLFLLFLFCFFIAGIHAQWQYDGSPEIGDAFNFTGTRDSLFVCSEAGLFFSEDEGNSWAEINIPDTTGFLTQVKYDQGYLYLTTVEKDIDFGKIIVFRSTNLGLTWTDISPFRRPGFLFPSLDIKNDTLFFLYDDSLAVSLNRGGSFIKKSHNNPLSFQSVINNHFLFIVSGRNILRSADLGTTWDTIFHSPESSVNLHLYAIDGTLWSCHFYSNSSIMVIRKSIDNGSTWGLINEYNLPDSHNANMTGENNNLFLYNGAGFTGIFRSVDGGKTWLKQNSLRLRNLYYSEGLLLSTGDRINPSIQKSSDNGMTFSNHNSGFRAADVIQIVPGNDRIYIKANYRILYKDSDSTNWKNTFNDQIARSADGHLYALEAGDNLIHSSDGGKTWFPLTKPNLGGTSHNTVIHILSAGNLIFLCSYDQVWYSLDHGESWHKIMDPELTNQTFDILFYHDGKFTATTWDEQIFSSDDGIHWDNITFDFPPYNFSNSIDATFIYHYKGNTFVFMNNFFGRLSDGNSSWEEVPHPIPSNNTWLLKHPITFMVSHVEKLFIGVFAHGIYMSEDEGHHWRSVNTGLNDYQVNCGVLSNDSFYLGVNGGVWKRSLMDFSSTSISETENNLSFSVSPNPANDFLNITINDPGIIHEISLSLFDSKGALIKSQNANTHFNICMDIRDIPSGIYFLQGNIGNQNGIIKVIKN